MYVLLSLDFDLLNQAFPGVCGGHWLMSKPGDLANAEAGNVIAPIHLKKIL